MILYVELKEVIYIENSSEVKNMALENDRRSFVINNNSMALNTNNNLIK